MTLLSSVSASWVIYAASALGAVAICLLMPRAPKRKSWAAIGALLGCAALGGLWMRFCPCACGKVCEELGMDKAAFLYHYVFGFIALAAAVRVITHTRPVYAALWFILVVLACAGLFLTLSAEFVATAAVIIYGGAILVTYMFVIMLASPPQSNAKHVDDAQDAQGYDKIAREPLWACLTGFLLLATLLCVAFDGQLPAGDTDTAQASIMTQKVLALPVEKIGNTQEVGLDLFKNHPFAIELAGVLLLVSLIGAVVIAKMRVHNEDEVLPPQSA